LKFGIVGLGGNGGPIVQNLVYLGARDFVLVDHDDSSETNMNRLVTASAADVGTPKVVLARRMIKLVAPDARVHAIQKRLESVEALDALKGMDVLISCPDNDGVRVILNELSLAYRVPYFDLGVEIGVAEDGHIEAAGGRLAAVLPDGPCLYCMNLIDADEARYYLSSAAEQDVIRRQDYITGMDIDAPSVVGLNAAVAAAAVNELSMYLSGLRRVQPLTILDLLGTGKRLKAQWMVPAEVARKPGCPACEAAGSGDACRIERYRCDS
jgi:molybdopterin/thiamine biosynthesis adenylyltransferase